MKKDLSKPQPWIRIFYPLSQRGSYNGQFKVGKFQIMWGKGIFDFNLPFFMFVKTYALSRKAKTK